MAGRRTSALVGLAVVAVSVSSCAGGDDFDLAGLAPHQIVISEIHYSDPSASAAEEFVELHNSGAESVPLGNWCIRGTDYCFPEGTRIDAGATLVVTASEMGSRLDPGGDSLVLVDSASTARDVARFGSRDPWPRTTDGVGYSLQRRLPATGDTSPGAWIAWFPTPGETPDESVRTTPSAVADVVINEIHYHPDDDDPAREFVELVNVGTSAVDVTGWCLVEAGTCLETATIAPGGFLVVSGFSDGYELPNNRATLALERSDGSRADLVHWRDDGLWPALADGDGHSLQRRDPLLSGLEPGNWASARPTAGEVNRAAGSGLTPSFVGVEHDRSPAPDAPVRVRAIVRDATTVTLAYRIGFGEEVAVAVTPDATGNIDTTVPGQPAGSLVRFRLVAETDGRTGTWPRQGDGSRYLGTVVTSEADTALPRLQWFMPDDEYDKAYADRGLYRDEGYDMVLAYDGVVFDNARIRIKGQQSRGNDKKKWKVVLPPGHVWDEPDLFPGPVDEFGLHSMETDKSMLREVLTSDLQRLSGGMGQRVTPVRLERNGEFYGLYLTVELPDGRWRERQGLSDDTVVVKAERTATLRAEHLNLARDEFDSRYKRQTQRWLGHNDEVRGLIEALADGNKKRKLDFLYRNVDLPQVIEAIATMRVAQHFEWAHKNYTLFFDPTDAKWRLLPIDHDLNMGNRWHMPCEAFCYETIVYPWDHFNSNRLGNAIIETPELRAMLDRRTKTLADAFLAEGLLEARVTELVTLYGKDAYRDQREWNKWRASNSLEIAQRTLVEDFVVPKRALLVLDKARKYPRSQKAELSYSVDRTGDGTVTVTNTDSTTIDLSGMTIAPIDGTVPPGTVLNPGQSVILTNSRVAAPDPAGPLRSLHVWVPSPLR
jgi:hypothetical protein